MTLQLFLSRYCFLVLFITNNSISLKYLISLISRHRSTFMFSLLQHQKNLEVLRGKNLVRVQLIGSGLWGWGREREIWWVAQGLRARAQSFSLSWSRDKRAPFLYILALRQYSKALIHFKFVLRALAGLELFYGVGGEFGYIRNHKKLTVQ